VVPPTPERVQEMLAVLGDEDPELLIGYLAARGRGVTLEKAAVNAVMAGCLPTYFPVVVAALEAMFDPDFNLHAVLTSTGGAALCTVVSGPIAQEIGMNARHGVFGPGNRPNATIGRAIRLVSLNVLGSTPGDSDASSFGHPGKYTFCFAEDPPPEPWQPLHVQLGYAPGDTTVTILPTEAPRQIAQQMTRSTELVLTTVASAIRSPAGHGGARAGARRLLHRRRMDAGGRPRVPVPRESHHTRRVARQRRANRQGSFVRGDPRQGGQAPLDRVPRRRVSGDRGWRGRRVVGVDPELGSAHHGARDQSACQADRRASAGLRAGRLHRAVGSRKHMKY